MSSLLYGPGQRDAGGGRAQQRGARPDRADRRAVGAAHRCSSSVPALLLWRAAGAAGSRTATSRRSTACRLSRALEVTDLVVGYDGTTALRGVEPDRRGRARCSPCWARRGRASRRCCTRWPGSSPRGREPSGWPGRRWPATAGRAARAPRPRGRVPELRAVAAPVRGGHRRLPRPPARRRPRAQARAEALEIMARLRIAHLAGRRPAELSGGEQQRVGLARALARRPSLYLFDEPTAHLDTHVRAVFLEELAARRGDSGAAARLRDPRRRGGARPGRPGRPAARRAAAAGGHAAAGVRRAGRPVRRPADRAGVGARTDGRLLVRPGWARLGGPADGRGARGAGSAARTPTTWSRPRAGEVLIREPGPPCHPVGARPGWTLLRSWPLSPGSAEQPRRRAVRRVVDDRQVPLRCTRAGGPTCASVSRSHTHSQCSETQSPGATPPTIPTPSTERTHGLDGGRPHGQADAVPGQRRALDDDLVALHREHPPPADPAAVEHGERVRRPCGRRSAGRCRGRCRRRRSCGAALPRPSTPSVMLPNRGAGQVPEAVRPSSRRRARVPTRSRRGLPTQ